MTGPNSNLTLVAQPQEYFYELITDALTRQKVRVAPEVEFYLVNLLNRFITSESLYTRDADGNVRQEPLALMIKEALDQPRPADQSSLFRHVGDVSLYTAGFFQDSLTRKVVNVDYYIGLGESAYRQVAARQEERGLQRLYAELAKKFAVFVDLLAMVSDKTAKKTEKDLLRLYDLWLHTKSERLARALQEAGILPNETVKKSYQ